MSSFSTVFRNGKVIGKEEIGHWGLKRAFLLPGYEELSKGERVTAEARGEFSLRGGLLLPSCHYLPSAFSDSLSCHHGHPDYLSNSLSDVHVCYQEEGRSAVSSSISFCVGLG